MPNYSYVIPTYYDPTSYDQTRDSILTRLTDLSDKMDEQYVDLKTKSGEYKYLSDTLPENSEARKIYEQYANDLQTQANNLISGGVNFDTRNALLDLRGRYSGEIGMLDKAAKKLEEENTLRRQEYGKDNTLIYAYDNPTIDDYIKGRNPNQYRVSGNDLYARGVASAKAISMRTTSTGDAGSVLGGYYRDWVTKIGMGQATMDDFRRDANSNPTLLAAADAVLRERGVDKQLTGDKYNQAREYVINGIIDGVGYQEEHKPVRDEGVMSAEQKDASARGWAAYNLQKEAANREKQDWEFQHGQRAYSYKDLNGNTITYQANPVTGNVTIKTTSPNGVSTVNTVSSSKKEDKNKTHKVISARKITWDSSQGHNKGGTPSTASMNNGKVSSIPSYTEDEAGVKHPYEHSGVRMNYSQLPGNVQDYVANMVDDPDDYEYYYKNGRVEDGKVKEGASLEIIPLKQVSGGVSSSSSDSSSNSANGGDVVDSASDSWGD